MVVPIPCVVALGVALTAPVAGVGIGAPHWPPARLRVAARRLGQSAGSSWPAGPCPVIRSPWGLWVRVGGVADLARPG